ncbi:MAG: hypothetical protein HZA53_06830 [Planctomycetes bacterium]|nr:hypothetical protein [Planctomycetota bacterium]
MKTLAVVLSILLATAVALVLVLRTERPEPARVADAELVERAARIEARLDEVARRLEALERRSSAPLDAVEERAPVQRQAPNVSVPAEAREHGAVWYLDQYVASFDAGGEGSEYFRLIVDAYVTELVEPVSGLVTDAGRPLGLRLALVRMLGKARFRGDGRVIDTLVAILRADELEPLSLAAIEAWGRIGDADASPHLEALVWRLGRPSEIQAALRALLKIAGERANQVLVRLLFSAPDEASAKLLVALLDGADLDAALAFFQRAAQLAQPVRLPAAQRIGEFVEPPFQRFVEDWLRVETDPAVIAALGGARDAQQTVPPWSATQATGAPNADPKRDDPHAWAPLDPEMGVQWLQLEYAAADRITGVNAHETCAPGAISELRARDTGGTWHVLWSGSANSGGSGPLEIRFAPTTFRTQTLRLVLDTNRTEGWNEIDAVEVLGIGGRQWATGASASSTYAQRGNGGRALEFTSGRLFIEGR